MAGLAAFKHTLQSVFDNQAQGSDSILQLPLDSTWTIKGNDLSTLFDHAIFDPFDANFERSIDFSGNQSITWPFQTRFNAGTHTMITTPGATNGLKLNTGATATALFEIQMASNTGKLHVTPGAVKLFSSTADADLEFEVIGSLGNIASTCLTAGGIQTWTTGAGTVRPYRWTTGGNTVSFTPLATSKFESNSGSFQFIKSGSSVFITVDNSGANPHIHSSSADPSAAQIDLQKQSLFYTTGSLTLLNLEPTVSQTFPGGLTSFAGFNANVTLDYGLPNLGGFQNSNAFVGQLTEEVTSGGSGTDLNASAAFRGTMLYKGLAGRTKSIARCGQFQAQLTTGGTVTTLTGMSGQAVTVGSSGQVAVDAVSMEALPADPVFGAVAGSITNGIGLKVHESTGATNRWAMQQVGTGGLGSYFANKVHVGGVTSSAVSGLEVTGDTQLNNNIGFYGTTPVAQSAAYTPTNVSADRAFDANATSINELADVLGTLIADLQLTGLIA